MGMFLRRGTVKKDFTVDLSGDMVSEKAYAEIDGVLYTQAGTHVFPEGTSITVFCYCNAINNFSDSPTSTITMNGTIVKKAKKREETIHFTFPLSGNTSINFIVKTFGKIRNYHCDITTN